MKATDISFGAVDTAALDVAPPAGAKVTLINLGGAANPNSAGSGKAGRRDRASVSPKQIAAQLPFTLAAPGTLADMSRGEVRAVQFHGTKGALVTYGAGLGGIAVLEQTASARGQSRRRRRLRPLHPRLRATVIAGVS